MAVGSGARVEELRDPGMVELGEDPALGIEAGVERRRLERNARLIATSRSNAPSSRTARYTTPMPPSPRMSTIRHGPSRSPASSPWSGGAVASPSQAGCSRKSPDSRARRAASAPARPARSSSPQSSAIAAARFSTGRARAASNTSRTRPQRAASTLRASDRSDDLTPTGPVDPSSALSTLHTTTDAETTARRPVEWGARRRHPFASDLGRRATRPRSSPSLPLPTRSCADRAQLLPRRVREVTLQPTVLVHEAFFRLIGQRPCGLEGTRALPRYRRDHDAAHPGRSRARPRRRQRGARPARRSPSSIRSRAPPESASRST